MCSSPFRSRYATPWKREDRGWCAFILSYTVCSACSCPVVNFLRRCAPDEAGYRIVYSTRPFAHYTKVFCPHAIANSWDASVVWCAAWVPDSTRLLAYPARTT
ncbi:hypothetical protein RvY_09116-3 [Ramazzottius varieornatus]|uniref:Uncharacterized protein n=1 Tax=Ramazzottius varieornatus TaxID=947166 RepID=A0A1D1VCU0_RAMVA|nr:hypothetical protein RvY_09116-3 [Ramazzottius varieornatus]